MRGKLNFLTMVGIFLVTISLLANAAGAEEKKLRIIFTDTYAPHINRMEQVMKEFEQLHPGVDVVMDALSWGMALQKVSAMKAAGSPDIIHFNPPCFCR